MVAPAATEAATGEEAMEEAVAEASAMFTQMGIAAPYVQEFEDESEVSHSAAMDPPVVSQEEEEQEEDALYACVIPSPDMAS